MSLRYLTAGESHGPALVAILEGLPAGLAVPVKVIHTALKRRRQGLGAGPRMKLEQDRVKLLAGVMAGMTTGAPLALWIENGDHIHWKDHLIPAFTIPRPGHVDLAGAIKYGYHDLRPALERASARETAARVAVGAICQLFLQQFGIHVGAYVVSIGEVSADLEAVPPIDRPERAIQSPVSCPDPVASARMEARIQQVIREKDTLGGVIEAIAWGAPAGLGSFAQWDRRLDARLGSAMLSIPAVKGVEIGYAFENTRSSGTQVHDSIVLEGDRLTRSSNHAGGLEGGMTNGQPIFLRVAMKPIATTLTPQVSVDLAKGEPAQTHYERSDFCPVPRAVPVVEAMLAFVLAQALLEKLGGDSMEELLSRFAELRQARLGDLRMDGRETVYWPDETDNNGNASEGNASQAHAD